MTKRVSAAAAKAHLSALAARAAYSGERHIIERRGKPFAALVSVEDPERLEREQAVAGKRLGLLALAGAWSEHTDEEIDQIVAAIYSERERHTGRPVVIEGGCT